MIHLNLKREMKSEPSVCFLPGRSFVAGLAICGIFLFAQSPALARNGAPASTLPSHDQIVQMVQTANASQKAVDADQVGWAYFHHKDYATAKVWFEHALKLDPKDPDGVYGLTASFLHAGHLDQAESVALAHPNHDPRMRTLYGDIYAQRGFQSHQSLDYGLSVEQFKHAQKYRPLTHAELTVKADDYLKLQRNDDAERIFKMLNRAAPDQPSADGRQAATAKKKVDRKTDRLPVGDWKTFKAKFVSRDGRVIDTGNKNVSHSEGQGYGMLLAESYGDRPTFDRMWQWTQTHLQVRGDHLFSWRWSPNPAPGDSAVSDPNNASDGGLLIAWALFRACQAWGDQSYHQASRAIVEDLKRKCVLQTRHGPLLLPAEIGFLKGQQATLNPSYFIFEAYRELGEANSSDEWKSLENCSLKVISHGQVGKWKLPPDWLTVSPQSISLPEQFPKEFGYNAVRVPLYLAWRDPRSPLLRPFYNFWHSFPSSRIPAGVNLETNQPLGHPASPGMKAIAQWITACVENRPIRVENIPALGKGEDYYSACLKLLTKVAIQETNARAAAN